MSPSTTEKHRIVLPAVTSYLKLSMQKAFAELSAAVCPMDAPNELYTVDWQKVGMDAPLYSHRPAPMSYTFRL